MSPMHLKSISMKGFKSFPERTRLTFSPGVSVIVGPNGCGKSNITDAVLWALGEQSPSAVRGQTMQDVIFAGGEGQAKRRYAEVEVVIDNSDGAADTEFSEISVRRRLDRSGEGEYRINGARCRLIDVVEMLSEANLGGEMHSVISQGKVEEVVHSKPRERRLLIEEAAGLGKHRKRRRRAELKLERTRDNLDRALDVEREARSHLRPLKRQAQAAETHARLERQEMELRAPLVADELGRHERELAGAAQAAGKARGGREELEAKLAAPCQLDPDKDAISASVAPFFAYMGRKAPGGGQLDAFVAYRRTKASVEAETRPGACDRLPYPAAVRAPALAGVPTRRPTGRRTGSGPGRRRTGSGSRP
jgi:chromosome segregation protein